MVKINRIYTRTGDDGTTGLVGGSRVQKDSLRVVAYGEVDELNSFLGLARTVTERAKNETLSAKIEVIQNELFDIGAELASPPKKDLSQMPTVTLEQVQRLEQWIDELAEPVPELRSFVLPGGSEANSVLHIARAVCRRCERTVITLARTETVSRTIREYLNRLSDLLFAMARFDTHAAKGEEYLWRPGASRNPAQKEDTQKKISPKK